MVMNLGDDGDDDGDDESLTMTMMTMLDNDFWLKALSLEEVDSK